MNIALTLDYELFLNDNTGSVDNCLVRPMLRLLDVCRDRGVKLTVFVDASYLVRLKELSSIYPVLNGDLQKVTENIRLIKSQGHAIELHIHPQWFYSDFDGEKWIIDFEHYKLSDIPEEETFKRFSECKKMLESIIDDQVIGFRAGGYSLQSFKYLKELFTENNIGYDSSVLRGATINSALHYFDYKKAPQKCYYNFDSDIIIENKDGDFIEFPIDTKSFFMPYFIIKKRVAMRKYGFKNSNYGDGGDNPISSPRRVINSLLKKLAFRRVMSGNIDYQSFFFLNDIYRHKIKVKHNDLLVLIAHPKNFSNASIDYLKAFIDNNNKHISFLSLTDIYNKLKQNR